MDIRDAAPADIPSITRIYNEAVLNTAAIWNEAEVDEANRMAWLVDRNKAGYPILVAIAGDGALVGYASFCDWRPWDGYRHTVENSVYVRADQRGKGVGAAMMMLLIERARGCGKHVMVASIEAENAASIRLHERLGFEKVGHLKQVGTKFGRWLDLAFLQLTLGSGEPVTR